jgi:hypothetical protein
MAIRKVLKICYVICVVLFFGCVGLYLSDTQSRGVPSLIELIGIPGVFIAVFCLVGVHSEHFILVSILANIVFYLLTPWLLWKVFLLLKKR